MNSIISCHFEDLKQYVLREACITDIAPYECRKLSVCIERQLNKKISETTIKRIYGQSKFNPLVLVME